MSGIYGIHNDDEIGPYTTRLRVLVEAVLRWRDCQRRDTAAAVLQLDEASEGLPDDFTVHIEEELRLFECEANP